MLSPMFEIGFGKFNISILSQTDYTAPGYL